MYVRTSLREEKQRQVAEEETIKSKNGNSKSNKNKQNRREGQAEQKAKACWLGDWAETAGVLCVCYITYLDDVDSGRHVVGGMHEAVLIVDESMRIARMMSVNIVASYIYALCGIKINVCK